MPLSQATPAEERRPLLGMDLAEIGRVVREAGEPVYRAKQIYSWIYSRRAAAWSSMTDLPLSLREALSSSFHLERPRVLEAQVSSDGTVKRLMSVPRGRIESVMIPEPSRVTFCISSQSGCALDCAFCLTARMGFLAHLTPGEIVSQVLLMLEEAGTGQRPLNIVFMGMGEPLHNYDSVMKAFRLLSDPEGVGIPRRRITLSTAGLVPGIRRLAQEPVRPRLAISLNASDDETRSRIMPINRKHPLDDLLEAAAAVPLHPRERVTFEYVLLEGVNASPEDARRLCRLFRRHRLRAKLNLIPFNPGSGLPFRSPAPEQAREFREILIRSGYPSSIRKNRGRDISAACGQLAAVEGKEKDP